MNVLDLRILRLVLEFRSGPLQVYIKERCDVVRGYGNLAADCDPKNSEESQHRQNLDHTHIWESPFTNEEKRRGLSLRVQLRLAAQGRTASAWELAAAI